MILMCNTDGTKIAIPIIHYNPVMLAWINQSKKILYALVFFCRHLASCLSDDTNKRALGQGASTSNADKHHKMKRWIASCYRRTFSLWGARRRPRISKIEWRVESQKPRGRYINTAWSTSVRTGFVAESRSYIWSKRNPQTLYAAFRPRSRR